MPLETVTYISDLNTANPAVSDGLVQGDDHIRNIKSALKNTFPNINAAVIASDEDLIRVANGYIQGTVGTAGHPSITFAGDLTAGFRQGTRGGQTLIEGNLRGNGAVPMGSFADFPLPPASLGSEWLECDGTVYTIAAFPDLGAFLGGSFGGNGTTTFGVPNLHDTGRFRRSRSAAVAAGTAQGNTVGTHTHTGTTASAGAHSHTATVADPTHAHTYTSPTGAATAIAQAGSSFLNASGPLTTGAAATGITVSIDTQGSHTHTFTTDAAGGTETRPESFVVVTCIKT